MTRYFYDCEFIDDGWDIDLISIGMACEDGRELYLQSAEFTAHNANEWVKTHVFPHLMHCPRLPPELALILHRKSGQCTFEDPEKGIAGAYAECPWRTREQIKREILAFMDVEQYGKPELWANYGAYDHVAFAQIFGTMMDLPAGFPMYTHDIQQWADELGNPKLPEQAEGQHNALEDARWNKQAWEYLHSLMPITLMPARYRNLRITEWCVTCGKAKTFYGEMVMGSDEQAQPAPPQCMCSFSQPAHPALFQPWINSNASFDGGNIKIF